MKFEVGKYYRTREGRKARVVCVDRQSNCGRTIVALIAKSDKTESVWSYFPNGKTQMQGEHSKDIVSKWREPLIRWAVVSKAGLFITTCDSFGLAVNHCTSPGDKVIKLVEEKE